MNQTFSGKDTNSPGKSRLHNVRALWIQFNNCVARPAPCRVGGVRGWGSGEVRSWGAGGGPGLSDRGVPWEDAGDRGSKRESWTSRGMIHVFRCVGERGHACACMCVNLLVNERACVRVRCTCVCAWIGVWGCVRVSVKMYVANVCAFVWVLVCVILCMCVKLHECVCVCVRIWCRYVWVCMWNMCVCMNLCMHMSVVLVFVSPHVCERCVSMWTCAHTHKHTNTHRHGKPLRTDPHQSVGDGSSVAQHNLRPVWALLERNSLLGFCLCGARFFGQITEFASRKIVWREVWKGEPEIS